MASGSYRKVRMSSTDKQYVKTVAENLSPSAANWKSELLARAGYNRDAAKAAGEYTKNPHKQALLYLRAGDRKDAIEVAKAITNPHDKMDFQQELQGKLPAHNAYRRISGPPSPKDKSAFLKTAASIDNPSEKADLLARAGAFKAAIAVAKRIDTESQKNAVLYEVGNRIFESYQRPREAKKK
jgi:hypothetical protein